MSRPVLLLIAVCVVSPGINTVCTAGESNGQQRGNVPQIDFSRDVLPIFSDKCFHCHGPDETTREAELRLDRREFVFADRDGSQIIEPGKPESSELVRRIVSNDADEQMPPPSEARQLTEDETKIIRRWVAQGAKWNQHWSFVPPLRPELPEVSSRSWSQNAIDHFVLARLDRKNLKPSQQAEKQTLIRRVTLDLTGLPPTPAEVDAFLADNSPDGYETLVDRLMASPRYGEHMAGPWLDAARYADTDGYQNDRTRYMWPWRDWVIMALNRNMPFDQFTIEQLAGDMLPGATLYQQIATGFCRNHRINSEGGSIPDEWAVEYVADRIETLGTVWLGLTIGCARCHDHKYDPISQKEYYQLFAYFNNVPEWGLGPNNGNSPPLITVPKNWPHLSAENIGAIEPAAYELVTSQTSVVRPKPGGKQTVMVMHELPEPRPTFLLRRGQYNLPDKSEVLKPSVPSSLGTLSSSEKNDRLALARWLVAPSNPLTARVTVNRYWQLFFGVGLVKTSENFGVQGERPSHPQLLDWLATEFICTGWDVKAMHKLIVTSETYRQSSNVSGDLLAKDPENRLLARGSRRRLSGKVIRDSALAISGLLTEKTGGRSVKPYMPPKFWRAISNNKYVQDHGENLYRRSLYTYWRRTVPPPTMMNFNAAEREVCLVRKAQTNSPLQALTLMNNVLFLETSRLMGERMLKEGGALPDERVAYGFRLATGRQPTDTEEELLLDAYDTFLSRFQNDPLAAEKLLNIGEFPYDTSLDVSQLAAMTMVASTIMNLDETITKE
jgi:hypothetical protein